MVSVAGRAPGAPAAAEALVSPEGATELLRRSGVPVERAEPDYVRVKPGGGMLVGYRLRGRGPDGEAVEVPGYVRAVGPARAAAVAAKWATMRPAPTPLGPGFRLLADGATVLFLFPTDARLRDLRAVAERSKLKRILAELPGFGDRGRRVSGKRSTIAPVRYKPERRFIAAADLTVTDGDQAWRLGAFLRLFPDARGRRLAELAEAIRTGAGASLVPRPLGAVLGGRLFVEERATGRELLDELLDGTADGSALADAVRRLHGAAPPRWLPHRTAASIVSTLETGLATMADAAPRLGPAARVVLGGLRRAMPAEAAPALLHGDLHLHQVIVSREATVLVDLERAGVGDPLHDLGELLAHIEEVARARPEAAARLARFGGELTDVLIEGRRTPDAGVRFYVAAATANRALLPFRRLEPEWVERSRALLDLAAATLDGAR
ncbi:MAG TPA: phosphotransferase [Actinomycetota bacterium]|nr:phosphotransferase [Actinomycetota bacterium]